MRAFILVFLIAVTAALPSQLAPILARPDDTRSRVLLREACSTIGERLQAEDWVPGSKLAVLPIAGDRAERAQNAMEEVLIEALKRRSAHVTESRRLRQILEEQRAQCSGLYDVDCAKLVGRLAGATHVLIAEVHEEGNWVMSDISFDVRVVDVRRVDGGFAGGTDMPRASRVAWGRLGLVIAGFVSWLAILVLTAGLFASTFDAQAPSTLGVSVVLGAVTVLLLLLEVACHGQASDEPERWSISDDQAALGTQGTH